MFWSPDIMMITDIFHHVILSHKVCHMILMSSASHVLVTRPHHMTRVKKSANWSTSSAIRAENWLLTVCTSIRPLSRPTNWKQIINIFQNKKKVLLFIKSQIEDSQNSATENSKTNKGKETFQQLRWILWFIKSVKCF